MKVVLKKTIADKFRELMYKEVYEKKINDEDVEYVSVTYDEALEMFEYSAALNRRFIPDKEKINTVNKSHFCGFKIKVEGWESWQL